ncbi:MAG: RNA polymerase sigma factor [Gammaproteobacteria bacterium]|nr:RNA polymerase sigma factor [Gammaproteobacteria bacterium]
MTDELLIKRCQEGDREAFTALLEQHYDSIYRIAYKWCDDQHNAQDITQQVCIKLARAIQGFEFRAQFSSWLYSLVINCARDFYKSPRQYNQREQSFEEQTHAGVSVAPATHARHEQRLYAQQVLAHIETLEDDLRDALVLVFGRGLNHRQAAQHLNIKESTVSWRVHEARKILQQTFDSADFDLHDTSAISTRGLT